MTARYRLGVVATLVLALATGFLARAQLGPPPPRLPGLVAGSATLLPNGWTIAPAGRHFFMGDLPLNLVLTPDRRYAIVTNNGWSKPTLTMIDLTRELVTSTVPVDNAWFGLAWDPDGERLYSSGGGENVVYVFRYANGSLRQSGTIPLGRTEVGPHRRRGRPEGFVGGLAVSPDGHRLYAVQVFGAALTVVDVGTQAVTRRLALGAEPYAVVVSPDGSAIYVSFWGGARVAVFDAATLERRGDLATDEHPNAMAMSRDGRRLYVACANRNTVWVFDLQTRKPREQISMALYPQAPPGSTPNALALSADERTLLVANADNNTVAVVDVASDVSEVKGFIPTGWYPTGVLFDDDRSQLLVLSGKGLTSQANPRGPQAGSAVTEGQYTGSMLHGALSMVPVPDAETLRGWTRRVYEVTPYSDARRLSPAGAPVDSPIPHEVGGASPIRHVFYIIRENRTYDQVLGDLERGNGDPALTLFGERVTPNAHALAREFVLFDNFYVNAEVSYDGHAYSMGAYATDFIEKIWPTNYGSRGGLYLGEGGGTTRNPFGNVTAPADGYLWDFAGRAGVSVRSYGEFAHVDATSGEVRASVPGLEGKVHPRYQPFDLEIPDNRRVDVWLEEFRQFEASGELPRLSIIRLGDDHTLGTQPGARTPRAMVAENDFALGRIIEAISSSRFWRESAVFVLEDDAQNGPDHVDAHRSVLLVASPFARRTSVDSTLYTTASVLRTIELILGLPPMSQYDASATPLYAAFQPTSALMSFKLRAARTAFDERNGPDAPGAEASLRMNLKDADMAPELELNQIIWESVRGKGSIMPPPVRSAFVRPLAEDEPAEREEREPRR